MVLSQSMPMSIEAITFTMKRLDKKKICDVINLWLLRSFFGNEETFIFHFVHVYFIAILRRFQILRSGSPLYKGMAAVHTGLTFS